MLELTITDEQRTYAKNLAAGLVRAYANHNKYDFRAKEETDYLGFLGEVVLCDYLGQPRPVLCASHLAAPGHDHNINGIKVNLKVTAYYGRDTYLKVRTGYTRCDFDGYLLAHIPLEYDTMKIIGYISLNDFKRKKVVRDFGHVPTDTVRVDQLLSPTLIGLL